MAELSRARATIAAERAKQQAAQDGLDDVIARFLGRDDDADAYLGNPYTLEALARGALLKVVEARLEAAEAMESGAEATSPGAVATAEADRFAKVVLGQDRSFTPISPEWNGPEGALIGQIRRRYDLQPAPPEVIAAHPFWALIEAYEEAIVEQEAGRDWQHVIDGALELVVSVLLGVDQLTFPFD